MGKAIREAYAQLYPHVKQMAGYQITDPHSDTPADQLDFMICRSQIPNSRQIKVLECVLACGVQNDKAVFNRMIRIYDVWVRLINYEGTGCGSLRPVAYLNYCFTCLKPRGFSVMQFLLVISK